ncbi:nuclear protein Es2-domain-containing protein [Catenaria anguillulae PL171]|uniref:Nuclear protein Es2-domain-containing protein n=1 Tax=Catenaria anguillulae PL171 TaxID=765915 RepID=A0A1Y2I4S3_9FUNG|nr:nuclear protein Es2-domain-containing protein [Catenaria anguillulae PL171]
MSSSNRNTVPLDEDEYTAALSRIIKRDFFPDLDRLRAEAHFLDALDSHDPALIALAKDRLDATSAPSAAIESQSQSRPQALDQFLEKFTSEDNASFAELLADHNARVRQRALKYFPPPDHHGPQLLLEASATATAAPVSPDKSPPRLLQAADAPSVSSTSTDLVASSSRQVTTSVTTGPARPPIHLIPLHDLLPNADHRPSGSVPTWAYKPHNALMFPPTSTVTQPVRRRGTTNLAGTRFHTPSPLTQLTDSIASASASTTRMTAPALSAPTTTAAPSDTPYSLVSMTPRPHGDVASMPPAFTWGAIDATPVAVRDTPSRNDDHQADDHLLTPGRYRIPDTPARDMLAMRMAASSSSSKSGASATPRTSGAASGLTPRAMGTAVAKGDVARKLLSRAGGIDSMLRHSYSGKVKKKQAPSDAGWTMRSTQSAAAPAGIATPFSFSPTPRRPVPSEDHGAARGGASTSTRNV